MLAFFLERVGCGQKLGFAYAACAASEVLKRMRALRIDGEYAKKSVAGDPHDHQELHH